MITYLICLEITLYLENRRLKYKSSNLKKKKKKKYRLNMHAWESNDVVIK